MTPLIIEMTTQSKPSNGTHWSIRTLADRLGIDKSMVHRVWQASGLKPHLAKTFKVSRDKKFVEKVIDVVGLYLNPQPRDIHSQLPEELRGVFSDVPTA
jgi:transcriptional regulator with XRE-family HTH domain